MKTHPWKCMIYCAIFAALPALAEQAPQTHPARDPVEGVWGLEKIVRPTGTLETRGGFIFQGGYYSTTVNYSLEGTQTNISQFGTYALEGNLLSLLPSVQVSTRGQIVIYDPEPPFSLDLSVTGDEMKGVSVKDGTTFVFRRLR